MPEDAAPCPLCDSRDHNPFPIYYLFNQKRFEGKECRTCGFIFIAPRPTESELALMYSDEYLARFKPQNPTGIFSKSAAAWDIF